MLSSLYSSETGHAKSIQSHPTLLDTMNCSPPGSSVHGILQARILEWAAISCQGDLPRIEAMSLGYLPLVPLGKPKNRTLDINTVLQMHVE